MALVRLSETDPTVPYGCLFVVDQKTKADQMYRELNAMLPGKVAVWTGDHDKKKRRPEAETKVADPAARFFVDQLKQHAVAIVTHNFYASARKHKAKTVSYQGDLIPRALTLVDESPSEVETPSVFHSQVVKVREAIQNDPDLLHLVKNPILALYGFRSLPA